MHYCKMLAGLHVSLLLVGLVFVTTPGTMPAQNVADQVPSAVAGESFSLSIRNIMRGPELVGEPPRSVTWTDDSRWVYFDWRPGGGKWSDEPRTWRVVGTGGEPELLSEVAADSLKVWYSGGALSPDRSLRATSVRGDLYVVDREAMRARRLTETSAVETGARFSVDGTSVLYRNGDNAFSIDLAGGTLRQLTDIRKGPEPEDDEPAEGQQGFLEDQQEQLFEHVRTDRVREARRDSTKERRESERPAPVYVDENERVSTLAPSPNAGSVFVVLTMDADSATRTKVPEWVTESGYTGESSARVKVGDEQGRSRAGLIDVSSGDIVWLELEDDADSPDSVSAETDPDDRLASIRFRGWNDAGTHALVAVIDFDYKTWRLYALAAAKGELTLLDSVSDSAWVGGPCMSCAGWLPASTRAWYVSEATGWAHLYAVDAGGENRRQLTSGDWEVRRVEIPEQRDRFLIHTSEGSPFDIAAWRLGFDGAGRERLTAAGVRSELTLSPDGRGAAIVRSVPNRPPELFVADTRSGSEHEQVTASPTAQWAGFPWIVPQIVRFEARDGAEVPARIYRPSDLGAEPNGAAVVFVHGAGYLQNVHNGWSSYYREYMFHHYLAALGYTVLDIDYRGSAGHGRDWRTGIYRWMGGRDLSDQVDGAAWLASAEGIDPARVGIYGGSYGGFITLMALFTEPEVFAAGAALRSVTDWAHYNHWYTARILNQPQDDAESYERSSPIYFAEGLSGHLLIAHGMEDDNVQFQDVVRLAQRLIELGKENWEMAVYPVEPHSFREPSSWTDEYRRIYELFARTIGTEAR